MGSCLTFAERNTTHESKMGKGDNGGFSEDQINMYKECFKLMDMDKDGTINKSDLRAAFDNVGKLMDESELDDMLSEVGGACTFDGMLKTWGDKFTQAEVDDIFGEFEVDDDGFIAAKDVIGLFVAGGGEPKEEEKK